MDRTGRATALDQPREGETKEDGRLDEVCVCVLGNQAEILLLVPHPVPPLLLVPPRIQMQLRLWLCRGKLLDRPSLGREEHHPLGHLGLRASEGETPARDEVQQALRTRREMGWRGREFARVRCVSERERDREEREWSRGHLRPRPHLLLLQSVWYTARAIAEEERKQEASAKEVGFSSSLWSEKLTKEVQVDEDGLPIPSAARASDPASCEGRDASLAMAMANRRGGRLSPRTRSGRTPKRLHSGVTRAGGSWASPSALRASTCAAARPRDGRTSRSLPSSSSPPSRSPEPMTCLLCTSRFVARCQAVVRTAGLARTFANFRPGKI